MKSVSFCVFVFFEKKKGAWGEAQSPRGEAHFKLSGQISVHVGNV